MPSQQENFVGVFIDWDNLAISTAVDFAGAVPDVHAIVKAAQKFGTILVARAYAEWNVSSERLSVYRAGIEPVYAPTFRFESESNAAGSKGKSLADPCLVTDCIDTLHLMPEINVFVLVSGDKDLIPIVRLAQLRGKKVAVIGPDFAAAILRDMADEYIPYRQVAESSENPPTEVSIHGVRSHRRAPSTSRSAQTTTRSQSPARATPLVTAPSPVLPEPNGNDQRHEPAAVVEPEPEVAPTEEALDPNALYGVIATILREREQAGKPRLRATNLKDQLLARISGFNERKYGFSRFKDLLTAAEKASVLSVTRTGPVQWVTGVSQTPPVVAEPTPAAEPPVPAAELAEIVPDATVDVDSEVVRFIIGLRERSRWLTYTYVLTNLLNHLGNGSADAASDAEARVTLNRLVQAGVLVVDREPREIDVNGTRHRVRLCHVVDEHQLVQRAQAELASVAAEPAAAIEEASLGASMPEASTPSSEAALAEEPAPIVDVVDFATQVASAPKAEAAPAVEPAPVEPGSAESAPIESEPATATVEAASTETVEPVADATSVEASAASTNGTPAEASVETTVTANGETEQPEDGVDSEAPPLTLAESFAVLREVVRDATDSNRPTTGPAAVKNRLVRKLGGFDEHAFGFSKFKDYLLSAERAGAIRLELSGTTTRVALAAPPEPEANN